MYIFTFVPKYRKLDIGFLCMYVHSKVQTFVHMCDCACAYMHAYLCMCTHAREEMQMFVYECMYWFTRMHAKRNGQKHRCMFGHLNSYFAMLRCMISWHACIFPRLHLYVSLASHTCTFAWIHSRNVLQVSIHALTSGLVFFRQCRSERPRLGSIVG